MELKKPRKILLAGLTLLALIVLGSYFLLFPPSPRPPAIARGLPSNFADADEEFGRRVLAAFPLPLGEDELTSRLSEQGFSVDTAHHDAIFEKSQFPCTLTWKIHWEAEDGSVNGLAPMYGGACL